MRVIVARHALEPLDVGFTMPIKPSPGRLETLKSVISAQSAHAEAVEQQIARTELGVERVVVRTKDTTVGSAGSSSASRQTYVTGGAVKAACEAVRRELFDRARARAGEELAVLRIADGAVAADDGPVATLVELLDEPIEHTLEWRHRPTRPVDPHTGQGNAHMQWAFSAHRAVVDVDTELGLVKVVELTTAQDVGKAMNPLALAGQIHGGTAQGLGLALMEEIQVSGGVVRNPSFTLTFTHPEVVNAGEPYTLDVTVTNTSESPANFVSVDLLGRTQGQQPGQHHAPQPPRTLIFML